MTLLDTLRTVYREVADLIDYQEEPAGLDHWQTPAESIDLGTGDCEDFAIMQYVACRKLGILERDLSLTYGRLKMMPHVCLQVSQNGLPMYVFAPTGVVTVTDFSLYFIRQAYTSGPEHFYMSPLWNQTSREAWLRSLAVIKPCLTGSH